MKLYFPGTDTNRWDFGKLSIRYYLWVFALLTIFSSCVSKQNRKEGKGIDNTFIVAAYNIRYASQQDVETGNGWDIRKEHVKDVIVNHQMDIVGTQEGNSKQLADLKGLLRGYEYFAHPYGGKDGLLHNTAIFFKSGMFTLLDSGVFWLSETPDQPSIGWDASDRRVCQWGKFLHKPSGKTFYFFNAHFYWRGVTAKENSGSVLVAKVKSIVGDSPVVLGGDLNSEEGSSQIKIIKELLADAYDSENNTYKGIQETAFSGGVFQGTPKARIDYLFTNKYIDVLSYKVGGDVYNNEKGEETYPSDHLPVISKVRLN